MTTSTTASDHPGTIVAASATDDHYAMPLAVTIRSALNHLGAGRRLQLFVLDGGLSDESKARLLKSWNDSRLEVEWVRPDMNLVRDLGVSYQVTVVTYLRLLMATLLPPHVGRAIYLDADMLVRRDLGELWAEEQGGSAVLAVPDVAAPCLDAQASLANFDDCREHLCARTPIANYRELGLPPLGRYFNGGLLVADLDQWRRDDLGGQMLACLRKNREHVLWWDQYALNVVLARRWRALDLRWNQGAHLFVYPSWRASPFDRATFRRLRKAPWIVHFCSPSKPWHYLSRHPFRREFFRVLDRTDWRGWRPERPENFLREWWNFHYRPLRNRLKSRIRAVRHAARARLRRAA
jgi:lipopolysaccharide biosynthesis glycosyltransferase